MYNLGYQNKDGTKLLAPNNASANIIQVDSGAGNAIPPVSSLLNGSSVHHMSHHDLVDDLSGCENDDDSYMLFNILNKMSSQNTDKVAQAAPSAAPSNSRFPEFEQFQTANTSSNNGTSSLLDTLNNSLAPTKKMLANNSAKLIDSNDYISLLGNAGDFGFSSGGNKQIESELMQLSSSASPSSSSPAPVGAKSNNNSGTVTYATLQPAGAASNDMVDSNKVKHEKMDSFLGSNAQFQLINGGEQFIMQAEPVKAEGLITPAKQNQRGWNLFRFWKHPIKGGNF
jgi:hypothetical protein